MRNGPVLLSHGLSIHSEDEALVDDAVHKTISFDRTSEILMPLFDIDLPDDNQGQGGVMKGAAPRITLKNCR